MVWILDWLGSEILTACIRDQGLDVIAEGLDRVKNMAPDMNEVQFLFFLLFLQKV